AALDAFSTRLGAAHNTRFEALLANLTTPRQALLAADDTPLSITKPLVMGVLNVTPDSFSDGGKHLKHDDAIAHGQKLAGEGADILDIGGESTRPGAKPVWAGEEKDRILRVIEALRGERPVISVDSRRAGVMEAAVEAGARIINDVSALREDAASAAFVAASGLPVILMHALGDSRVMQKDPRYDDALLDIYDFLEERVEAAVAAGISQSRIVVDPGIGFGKTVRHNLEIINGLSIFHGLGCHVLLGASRKSFIGGLTGVEAAEERLPGSLAAALAGVEQGVQIIRTHDVAETRQALDVWQGLADASYLLPG
ncbi:MAG: dihydropteroate synthase, partial [Proteobacteria bacterium]|nr:dihydropteroate synthase [Pseudomonadota bacterium]